MLNVATKAVFWEGGEQRYLTLGLVNVWGVLGRTRNILSSHFYPLWNIFQHLLSVRFIIIERIIFANKWLARFPVWSKIHDCSRLFRRSLSRVLEGACVSIFTSMFV